MSTVAAIPSVGKARPLKVPAVVLAWATTALPVSLVALTAGPEKECD